MYLLVLCFLFILVLAFYQKTVYEGFDNIPETIGNYLSIYFYHYLLSLCEEKDFHNSHKSDSQFLKELPDHIPFDAALSKEFKEMNISLEKLKTYEGNTFWECTEDTKMKLFKFLKPTVHAILNQAFQQANLKRTPLHTVIHFRCADVPFSKHRAYFLQKYPFFKESLEKINPPDKKVTLMNCSTHLSKKKEQDACVLYVKHMTTYLESIGYEVNIRCNTNVEDFADLFYAKAVISTGGSFSFMSGFFGDGQLVSTEHPMDGKSCTTEECNEVFIRGYNLMHDKVESYYEVDKVHTLLSS